MTRAEMATVEGSTVEYRGTTWRLGAPVVTSDHYVTAWAVPLADDGHPDERETLDGHTLFLGILVEDAQ